MLTKQRLYHLNPTQKQGILNHFSRLLSGNHAIVFAYVYGSFLEELPFHDIDVGLYLAQGTLDGSMSRAVDISLIVSNEINMPVECRMLNSAPVSFSYHVIQGRMILDRDPDLRSRFMERTISRYLDMRPLRRRALREVFSQ